MFVPKSELALNKTSKDDFNMKHSRKLYLEKSDVEKQEKDDYEYYNDFEDQVEDLPKAEEIDLDDFNNEKDDDEEEISENNEENDDEKEDEEEEIEEEIEIENDDEKEEEETTETPGDEEFLEKPLKMCLII